MQSSKDSIYANPLGEITAFKFDEAVVDVFPGTIRCSVPGDRPSILPRGLLAVIHRGLLPGGIRIFSEKLALDDERLQAFKTDMHHHFKKARGCCELEVSQKPAALENVWMPKTFSIHQQRPNAVGFSSAEILLR